MIDAVVFDFDGVIADTEDLHFETFTQVCVEEGLPLRQADKETRFLGVTDAGCFALVCADAGRDLSPALCRDLLARKSRAYQARVEEVRLFPGARELVLAAGRRGPVTIASCGRKGDIQRILAFHGLAEAFDDFISADELERSKPHPECFQKALALLRRGGAPGLVPERCLVFEDSYRGVAAAKAASMRVAAVLHTCPREALAEADWIIGSLEAWDWSLCGEAKGALR